MEFIVDIKQGYFHKKECRLVKPAMVLNQNEHDFRKISVNESKDLKKKNYTPCTECMQEKV